MKMETESGAPALRGFAAKLLHTLRLCRKLNAASESGHGEGQSRGQESDVGRALETGVQDVSEELWKELELDARTQGFALVKAKTIVDVEDLEQKLAAEAAVADLFGFSEDMRHPSEAEAPASAMSNGAGADAASREGGLAAVRGATREEEEAAVEAFEASLRVL